MLFFRFISSIRPIGRILESYSEHRTGRKSYSPFSASHLICMVQLCLCFYRVCAHSKIAFKIRQYCACWITTSSSPFVVVVVVAVRRHSSSFFVVRRHLWDVNEIDAKIIRHRLGQYGNWVSTVQPWASNWLTNPSNESIKIPDSDGFINETQTIGINFVGSQSERHGGIHSSAPADNRSCVFRSIH